MLLGLALTVLPAPTALASSGVSAHHNLTTDLHHRVPPELLRWVGAQLNRSAPAGPSRSSAHVWRHLATLRRPVCLDGCPPIMRPFSVAPSDHGAWTHVG